MNKKVTIKFFIILAPFIIFGYLLSKDFVLSGKLEIVHNFEKDQAMISQLIPYGRAKVENGKVQINSEPVYFDVRTPQKFSKAKIKIKIQKNSPDFKVGVKTGENWNFDFPNGRVPVATGGSVKAVIVDENQDWKIGEWNFDLKNAFINKYNLRFIISAPELNDSEKKIILDEIKVIYEK